jgi:RimJ/RimL family protein N-acetyltransferase
MIETERLILRLPAPGDRDALVGMFTDQEVMAQLFPGMDEAAADAVLAKHEAYRGEGLGFWTVERSEDGAVVGFCGFKRGEGHSPIAGEVEAGWIIGKAYWSLGYAREAMLAAFDWAWANFDTDRVYAITSAVNTKSQGLMLRLGMERLADRDYLSASFAEGHELRPTVMFAISRP